PALFSPRPPPPPRSPLFPYTTLFRSPATISWNPHFRLVYRHWLASAGEEAGGPYSIQTLKKLKPAWFRQDLIAMLDLYRREEIKIGRAHVRSPVTIRSRMPSSA